MKSRLLDQPSFYYALFGVLLVPALLINLGAHHLFVHTDESRRALVALEMILSGNYITPTLNGEFYYNKPPLYNWLIVLSFKSFGAYSALALRFPVVVAVVLYGLVVRGFLKPILGNAKAWLVAIATLTSGRILFYDSFLGLIDIAFGLLIFVNFMLFYVLGSQKRYYLLFAVSYLLIAATYLMKGLPPLVFQFFTVIGWAIYLRRWKLIFHPAHFIGFLAFLIPVALYYWAYLSANPQTLLTLFETLINESSKRTVTEYGFGRTLISLFTFPITNLYHFAPWTLLVVFLFQKGALKALWKNDFTRYAIIIFGLNIFVYWTSPGVHPRYLFMFLPLLFSVLWYAAGQEENQLNKIIQNILFVIILVGIALPFFLFLFADKAGINALGIKMIIITAGLGAVAVLYYKKTAHRWVILGIYLLVLRIAFDWALLPNRDAKGRSYEVAALKVAKLTEGEPLHILGPNYVHDGTSFLISRERGEILKRQLQPANDGFYIIYEGLYNDRKYQSFLKFHTRGTDQALHLVKIR